MKSITLLWLCGIFFFLHLVSPTCQAEMYKWRDESGSIHFSDKPPLSGAFSEKVNVFDSQSSDFSKISVSEFGFSIRDIGMAWYLSSSGFQKENIYHPQIEFVVQNDSQNSI